jgi:DNA-binding transcriptional MerR regulator
MSHDRAPGRYTVKQLAELSGVSVRTLHHYDALGLLRPAVIGDNGYRYYGRAELLRLQQILFHRELGLSLERIGEVIDAPDFDRAAALREQREYLLHEAERLRELVRTVDDTLAELGGGKAMDENAIYRGFSDRVHAWAIERYGDAARWGIETRNKVTESWSQADWDRQHMESAAIFQEFAAALKQGLGADDVAVQALVARFHAMASLGWIRPVTRGGMINMAEIYADNPDIGAGLGRVTPGLAAYVAQAIRVFAIATQPWPGEQQYVGGRA